MRALPLAAAAIALSIPGRASADRLPSGSMGIIVGVVSGTGTDSSRLGYGYVDKFSFQAAWHTGLDPRRAMDSDNRIGLVARWSTIFFASYDASAAQVRDLETVQMDLTLGVRVRAFTSPKNYFTARGGPALFRANQEIPPTMQRAFIGPVASVGFQHYFLGTLLLLDIDARYGLIGEAPTQLAFTAALSITGP
jgi:hypothetical protein